jgi:aryl-phospho-beta-D-glucosidase BglC (GH1 family)
MAATNPTTLTGTGATAMFTDTSDWGTGFTGSVTLANTAAAAMTGWTVTFNLANAITNIWNAQILSHTGTQYVIGNLSYNGTIASGSNTAFGFQANGGSPVFPTTATLNGATLSSAPVLPTLTLGDVSVTEGMAASVNETFTVKLSAASKTAVTVAYKTANGTAVSGTDYNSASGTLTFAAGVTSQTITVATHPGTAGSTKAYNLTLSAPTGATIARATATGSIVNPAPPPSLSVADTTVTEGTAATLNETFTVKLSAPSTTPVTVSYKTVNGTAIAGTDYTAATGTLTFAAGVTSQTVTVASRPGSIGSKTYSLILSAPSGATLSRATATGTIVTPTPAISVADTSVTEGTAASLNETFTVKLSAVSKTPVTVAYKTTNGTAVSGTDYNAASGTLTFAAGVTSQTITVATHPGSAGSTKAYSLVLSAPTNATIARGSATGSIVTPTPVVTPTATVGDVSVTETNTTTATGSTLLPSGALSTQGNQIVSASGTPVKIAAVNWYGLETTSFAPQGLWAQSYQTMMKQMVSLGFNTIRLPFSLQLLDPASMPNGIDFSKNPDLQGLNGLQVMDKIVAYANTIGLKIILDDHRSAAGSGPNDNGLWYDSGYTESQWIADWKMLAARYANSGSVIGADLSNEPHGAATWGDGSTTDWEAAATRAGDAIQTVNKTWLMFVEGVQTYQGTYDWWGGNLAGVKDHPVVLTTANKVVYSPHDYPASVSSQPWFSAANYPNNLPAVWDQYWGYIYKTGTAPVFVGEYGSKLETTSDQQWIQQLVAYMKSPGGVGGAEGISWGYWDWNPTSGDTGGILEDDWATVDPKKLAAITPGFYHAAGATVVSPSEVDFTVTLSAASTKAVTIKYATQDGTAVAGKNYTATSGTLTFAPGTTTEIVPVHLLGTAATSKLTFMLGLSDPLGASLGRASATATLVPGTTPTATKAAIASPVSAQGIRGAAVTTTGTTANTGTFINATSLDGHATATITSHWDSGLTATVSVGDDSASASQSWQVEIDTAATISNLWNGTILSHSGDSYLIGNTAANGAIGAHAATTFGFQAASTADVTVTAHLIALQ